MFLNGHLHHHKWDSLKARTRTDLQSSSPHPLFFKRKLLIHSIKTQKAYRSTEQCLKKQERTEEKDSIACWEDAAALARVIIIKKKSRVTVLTKTFTLLN